MKNSRLIQVGIFRLENDVECKVIPDGFEIFADAVKKHNINPDDFKNAEWMDGSIIVAR